jgi:addiction module HigA family antidote
MIITKRKPFTPGEILKEEFMEPYKLTQAKLAELLGVERRRINEIVVGRRKVTSDTAARLAQLFGNTAQFWLNLQMKTDLWETYNGNKASKDYDNIKPLEFDLV